MNVLIDTNVVLDDILSRGTNVEAARKISFFIANGFINGYLTANCLTDIFYVVSKKRDEKTARKVIGNLLITFMVVSVDGEDCRKALVLPMGDFEDALVVVCAEKANLNYIVTNDKGFLSSSDLGVPAITPGDLLLKLKD